MSGSVNGGRQMDVAPDLLRTRCSAAARALKGARVREAEAIVSWILRESPRHLPARYLLLRTRLCRAAMRLSAALVVNVASRGSASAEAAKTATVLLRHLGRNDEALQWAQRAAELGPEEADCLYLLGLCYLDLHRHRDAVAPLHMAVQLKVAARHFDALGQALGGLGEPLEAAELFRRADELEPGNAQLVGRFAEALAAAQDPAAAVVGRMAVDLDPTLAFAHYAYAQGLLVSSRYEEAECEVRIALDLGPEGAPALTLLGSILQFRGQMAEATGTLEQAIRLGPRQGLPYLNLLRSRRVGDSDRPLLDTMRQLCEDPMVGPADKVALHYGLGKAYEDLRDYGESLAQYDAANEWSGSLKVEAGHFDAARQAEEFRTLRQTFTRDFIERQAGLLNTDDPLPIFVVGMVRSGTTLVEQILSNHAEIGGVGELGFLMTDPAKLISPDGQGVMREALGEMATHFGRILRDRAPGRIRVVDKMPGNFMVLGLIHIAFPSATIIHVSRNPADTCFSIYATANGASGPWAHTKYNIAGFYREYRCLMSHWKSVLPAGRIHEVSYEELVGDTERVVRAMVQACGLSWDPCCLAPQANERPVSTPSFWQVRQPIYGSSVGRWEKYREWLPEFEELLGDSDVDHEHT